jgi:hypothetical protein
MIAFALIGMAWYSMAAKADQDQPNRWTWHDFSIIASIGLVPWVNQTSAGLAIIILPIYFLALCWFKRQFLTQVMVPCICAGFIAIGALPWYMQTLPGSAILTYDGPILYWGWGLNIGQAFLVALPLGVFAVWRIPDYRVKALGVMLLTFAVLLPWLSFDEVLINPPYRSRYLLAMAFYPVIAWVVFNVWIPKAKAWLAPIPHRMPLILASVVAFLFMTVVFVYVVREQAAISAMVTPETAEALEMIRDDKTSGTASNSFTLSLWVAGINKTPSPFLTTAPPPPAYVGSDVLLRCVFGWVPGCDGRTSAESLNIKYLLVEERFPYYNQFAPGNYMAPEDQWSVTANTEWLNLIYSGGSTRLYAIQ